MVKFKIFLIVDFFLLTICLYLEIASALTKDDIMKDWDWLGNNLFMVLNEMETEEEVTNFTICKIQSLVAHSSQAFEEEISDSSSFKVVASKFKERFNMADDEKLVNYYSCKYVSMNHRYKKISCLI